MQQYEKERTGINIKYAGDPAAWYRKKICLEAKNIPFNDRVPAKTYTESMNRAADDTASWMRDTNEKYQVTDQAKRTGQNIADGAKSAWKDFSNWSGMGKSNNQ